MDDETNIRRAIELAGRGRGRTSPNPMVGALVVSDAGEVLGEGWHAGPGEPHAEPLALKAAGAAAEGSTLYCSLEPCDHYGRTPPCTHAIIDAGIRRVVAAMRDPHPVVDGRGFARLAHAGIEVREGVLTPEAERLNEAYLKHARTGLPFVTLKMAATLDGKIAAADGSSTWITGEGSRAEVQRMRGAADAIMIGAGTVVADDPHLTVRDPDYAGPPVLRVVVDAAGRIGAERHVLDRSAPTLIATTEGSGTAAREAWREAGAEVLILPTSAGGVSLPELFEALGKRDVQSVLLEGGSILAGAAVGDGIVDKVVVFFAPKLLGGSQAPSILAETGVGTLADAVPLDIAEVSRPDEDVKVEAYVHRDR